MLIAYVPFMGRWSRVMAPLFQEFAGISDGEHILDVGSGTGSFSVSIASQRPHCKMVGIDPSLEFITYAEARVLNPNAQLVTGNAQRLSFPNAAFDACLSLLAFNFIPDPAKALAELRRMGQLYQSAQLLKKHK
jgi:ubiquinone/menaquinone biosynthesis C-methylase UbiE